MARSIAILAISLALLSGCETTPPPAAARVVAMDNKLFKFDRLRVGALPGQLVVRGRVIRKRRFYGRIPGHIHVEAFSGGTSLGYQDTRWRRLSTRPFAKSPFAVRFPIDPSRVDEVRVSYEPTTEMHEREPGTSSFSQRRPIS